MSRRTSGRFFDFSPENLADQEQLAADVHRLSDADLIRVFVAVGHEFLDRPWPRRQTLFAMTTQLDDEVAALHRQGLA